MAASPTSHPDPRSGLAAPRPLLIDVSPALINRTAVHRLVVDTVKRLEGRCRTRCLGKQAPSESFDLAQFARQGRALGFWLRHPYGTFARQRTVRARSGERVLYMDPLYVLFHRDLNEDSFVFAHDLTPLTRPDWHDPRVVLLYRKAFEQIAASRARIATISQSTANDLRVNLGIPSDRIFPILFYLANPPQAARSDRPEPFLLFVGNLELRKNVLGLIEGYRLSGLGPRGIGLKIVGGDAVGSHQIRALARSVPGVEILGFVSNEELNRLYGTCQAFVYPSFWEGFGVPLLEAMARGIPCVSLTRAPRPK